MNGTFPLWLDSMGTPEESTCSTQQALPLPPFNLDVFFTHVKAGHLEIIKHYVQQGLDPASITDEQSNTPLQLAIQLGHLELVQYLIPKSNLDILNGFKKTLLMLAVTAPADKALALTQLLLPFQNPNQRDPMKRTALMLAAAKGYHSVCELLLPVSDPNAQDYSGRTALMYAACFGHHQTAECLMHSTLLYFYEYKTHLTADQLAKNAGHHHLADMLLQYHYTHSEHIDMKTLTEKEIPSSPTATYYHRYNAF